MNAEVRGGFIGDIGNDSVPSIMHCYWERQEFDKQFLSENGIGFSNDDTLIIDPLSSDEIQQSSYYEGCESVLNKWNFVNSSAPVLKWE